MSDKSDYDDEDEETTANTARAPARPAQPAQPLTGARSQRVREQLALPPSTGFPWLEDLYGLPQCEVGLARSTEKTSVRPVWPWYHHYCTVIAQREQPVYVNPTGKEQKEKLGLALYDPLGFTETTSNAELYDKTHIREYFRWMTSLGLEKNLIKKSKTFINANLRAEHLNRMLAANHRFPTLGGAEIGSEEFARKAISTTVSSEAVREREEYRCIHSNVDKSISSIETQAMMRDVFDPKPNGSVAKLDPVYRLNFAASFNSSAQDLRRGEEHYKQWYNTRYLRLNEELGTGNGPHTHLVKSVKSKHNLKNRRETFGGIPHRDPIRDFAGWHGILLAYRLIVLKEVFPPFMDYEKLWWVASYPSLKVSEKVHGLYSRVSSDQYLESWKAFYEDNHICTGFITKQWRHQGYHDADDRGLDQQAIQKLAGWRHDQRTDKETQAEREHYSTNVPLRGMVAMAKGDPDHPERFYIPRYIPVPDEFLELFPEFAPFIRQQKDVETLYKSYKTKKKACENRVTTAHETALNFMEELRACFRLLASRPHHHKTLHANQDELCFYDKYRFCTTLRNFFDHPAFQSPLWTDFKTRIRQAEDAVIANTFSAPAQVLNQADIWFSEMRHMTSQAFVRQQEEQRNFMDQVLRMMDHRGTTSTAAVPVAADNITPSRSVIPVAERTAPPGSDGGGKRKWHKTSFEAVAQAEVISVDEGYIPRPKLAQRDRLFNSAREYWRLWKDEYEPLEKKFGNRWRNDRPYMKKLSNGKLKKEKANTKAQWWNERKFIWECISVWITNGKTEEEAIEKAEAMYSSCRKEGCQRKPSIRDVKNVFVSEAKRLGLWSNGRPRKDADEFGREFGWMTQARPDDSTPTQPRATPQETASPSGTATPKATATPAGTSAPTTLGWDPFYTRGGMELNPNPQPPAVTPTTPAFSPHVYLGANLQVHRRPEEWEHLRRQQQEVPRRWVAGWREQAARNACSRSVNWEAVFYRGRELILPQQERIEDRRCVPRMCENLQASTEPAGIYGDYRPDYTGPRYGGQQGLSMSEGDEEMAQLLFDLGEEEKCSDTNRGS